MRCHGYLDSTGDYARCAREECAGTLPQNDDGTFSHRLHGECRCGAVHGPERPEDEEVRHTIRAVDGTPLAVHARKGRGKGKRLWWEGPDGRSGLKGAKGRPKDWLYGAERLAGVEPGSHVFLVEGERAADALARRGFVAVGTVTGAGTVRAPHAISSEAAAMLAGLVVVAWPDADEVGLAHMAACARVLVAAGVEVRVLTWPGAPDGGDADDFTGSDDALVDLMLDAAPPSSEVEKEEPPHEAPRVIERPPAVLEPPRDAPIPEGFLREWCETMARGTEMPPASYLATGLVAVAAIAGPRLFIRWAPTRRERCNLWILNVGRSALGRKTTGMSAARWAVGVAAGTLGDGLRWYGPKRPSDAAMAVHLDVVGVDTAAAQEIEDAEAKLLKRAPRKVEEVVRRVPVSWVMALNEVAPLWGEGLRDWQAATSAFLLDLFDGELSSDTRASAVPSQEAFVCALGNIPPAELAERTTLRLLTSGFAGRWIILPSPGPHEAIPIPSLNGKGPMAALAGWITHVAERAAAADEDLDLFSLWTPEAVAMREGWYVEHFNRLRSLSGEVPEDAAAADLFGRLQATAAKLATVVAVTRQGARLDDLADLRVEASDVDWAQGVADESMRLLLDVVREGGGGATTSLGRIENRILSYLRRSAAVGPATSVAAARVVKATKNSDAYADALRAVDALIATGAVREQDGVVGPNGGRPARVLWLA